MQKKILWSTVVLLVILLTSCKQYKEKEVQRPHQDNLIFNVTFDHETGHSVFEEVSKTTVEVPYVYKDAVYKSDESLRWIKQSAVSGYALAFDGYTNKINYDYQTISVEGSKLTVDIFVAPRMFEWSAPHDKSQLQVIVGQFDKASQSGFVLGMHKYGHYSFQVGLGDRWVEIWNEWNPLERYKWNHITAVYDGDKGFIKMYKNGELVNEMFDVFGAIQPSNNDLIIGAHSNPQMLGLFELNMFNGMMDELSIYNVGFNADDVLSNHQSYKRDGRITEVEFEDAWLDSNILNDDYFKPVLHATAPQHWMNEPHALFQYRGVYHMFYQFNLTGPYWRQIVWGHWVSEDMITWEHVEEVFVMNENNPIKDGAWSGGVAFKNDGTPVLFITAGDDEKKHLISNQNLVIATPEDVNDPYLTKWNVESKLAVTQTPEMGRAGEFRDFTVYKEDDVWYMLATGTKHDGQGTAHIFSTKDDSFMNWDYHGDLIDLEVYPNYLGSSWELVNLVKVTNRKKTISKYVFILSPAGYRADNDVYYYIGDFDKETKRFIPENTLPLKLDYGENVFTGPGIYTDMNGRVLISSITQGQRSSKEEYDAGWAHSAGMPKELWLSDDGQLTIQPIKELYQYVGDPYYQTLSDSEQNINYALNNLNINDQTVYAKLSITNIDATTFGFKFKKDNLSHYTSLYYDTISSKIMLDSRYSGNTRVARLVGDTFQLKNNTLDIEIVIDHAVVEIYINNHIAFTASIYNIGTGFEIISNGEIQVNYMSIHTLKRS